MMEEFIFSRRAGATSGSFAMQKTKCLGTGLAERPRSRNHRSLRAENFR